MNLVADEDVAGPIVQRLRQDGHQVTYLAEIAPSTPDSEVLALSAAAGTLLITADKDFGELVYRLREQSSGVLLLRLHPLSIAMRASLVSSAIRQHGAELRDCFSVLSPSILRVRPRRSMNPA